MKADISIENSFEKTPYLQMIVFLPRLPGTINQVFKECNENPVLLSIEFEYVPHQPPVITVLAQR